MAEAAPQGNFTIARGMHRQLCAANNKLKRICTTEHFQY